MIHCNECLSIPAARSLPSRMSPACVRALVFLAVSWPFGKNLPKVNNVLNRVIYYLANLRLID